MPILFVPKDKITIADIEVAQNDFLGINLDLDDHGFARVTSFQRNQDNLPGVVQASASANNNAVMLHDVLVEINGGTVELMELSDVIKALRTRPVRLRFARCLHDEEYLASPIRHASPTTRQTPLPPTGASPSFSSFSSPPPPPRTMNNALDSNKSRRENREDPAFLSPIPTPPSFMTSRFGEIKTWETTPVAPPSQPAVYSAEDLGAESEVTRARRVRFTVVVVVLAFILYTIARTVTTESGAKTLIELNDGIITMPVKVKLIFPPALATSSTTREEMEEEEEGSNTPSSASPKKKRMRGRLVTPDAASDFDKLRSRRQR